MSDPGAGDDPVLAQRARIAKLADQGQRVGYLLIGVAVGVFVYGAVAGFGGTTTTIIVGAMVLSCFTLAPAIVAGYAVKAAEREDREQGRGTGET